MQFNESVDPDAPTPAPATLERGVSVNDDDVEIAQLLMPLPDQDEHENAGTVGVKQKLDIDDRIVYCFNPPWGNWGGTYKGPASAVADSAQGYCRVHWDGGKETAGRSTPARPVLKLQKTRISRTKQLRRAIRLWFVCVF